MMKYKNPFALDICGEVCLKLYAAGNTVILCSSKEPWLKLSIFTSFFSDSGYAHIKCWLFRGAVNTLQQ